MRGEKMQRRSKISRLSKNKRGADLSLNVIVVAALALLVLVILAIIFMGRTGMFRKESGSCANFGGSCSTRGCTEDYQRKVGYDCNLDGDSSFNEGQSIDGVCCITT
jgi:hypothetical protein